MSIFDYPRINIKGTISLSPGTANNDDYAASNSLPKVWGPFAGKALGLIQSASVKAQTYGMSDEAFIDWVQKAQTFDQTGQPGRTQEIIPAEWNYYGAMNMNIVDAKVIGVQTDNCSLYTETATNVPLSNIIGADLSFGGGHFTDVNSQGSPPATQFFIDSLDLKQGNTTLISGPASKGASQWLNFYRNVNLVADGGAGAYVYHVIYKNQAETQINIPEYQDDNIVGVIVRYYLYRSLGGTAATNADIEALYQQKKTNPTEIEIVGTIAPLYKQETIFTGPTGRLLVSNRNNVQTPEGARNNSSNNLIALAPAVLQQSGNLISADFVGTFPDYYQAESSTNNKYDFGSVKLVVSKDETTAEIAPVNYADTQAGDQKGWIFDFDLSGNAEAQAILQDPDTATFQLIHEPIGTVLEETDYYFVSNQQAIYGEQFVPGTEFLNQGTKEPATISVYHRGQELTAANCPPITLWQYRSIPLQAPGDAKVLSANFKPGEPIIVDTSHPGNFLFTFNINDPSNPAPEDYPPKSYLNFANPPYVTNSPSISLRILPNDEDFSIYYVDPGAEEPVGNELLTFEVVYEKALQTYYLLYPAMNCIFHLNSPTVVAQHAQRILQRTNPSIWMSNGYMPRTRDMSVSRTTLLQAWCRKVLQATTS